MAETNKASLPEILMPAKVLICNLTRFGDLLQTQPLIDGLANNGHKVSIVCLDNFAAATSLMRNIEQVHALPAAKIHAALDANWAHASFNLLHFIDTVIHDAQPNWVINLTPSLTARLLAKLLSRKGAKTLGFGLDNHGFAINHGVWTSFISVAALKRNFAPFNLADMFQKTCHSLIKNFQNKFQLSEPDENILKWADDFLETSMTPGYRPDGYVCFQLGASSGNRRWPESSFVSLGQLLWEKAKLCPVLLGTAAEKELADKYAQAANHPFIDAVGKTSLGQLSALLKKARLLVTNDTGTMHLAAGLDVHSLSFFLSTAQPWDTGPALENCCCLEPNIDCHPCAFSSNCAKEHACRKTISAESACSLIMAWLENGIWQDGITEKIGKECRVWVTERDEIGMLRLIAASNQDNEKRTQWMNILHDFWCQLFDSLDGIKHKAEISQKNSYPQDPEAAAILNKAYEILHLLVKTGAMLTINPQNGQKFLKNCQNLQTILDDYAPLACIGAFWREFQQNQGNDLKTFLPALKIIADKLQWLESRLFSQKNIV